MTCDDIHHRPERQHNELAFHPQGLSNTSEGLRYETKSIYRPCKRLRDAAGSLLYCPLSHRREHNMAIVPWSTPLPPIHHPHPTTTEAHGMIQKYREKTFRTWDGMPNIWHGWCVRGGDSVGCACRRIKTS